MNKKVLIIFLALALFVIAAGCKSPKITENDVKDYAPSLTERALIAVEKGDYASLAPILTDEMQVVMPEDKFNEISTKVNQLVGSYIRNSIKFQAAEKKGTQITVLYYADYTNDSPVQITITFENVTGEYKIAGLYFNSAKISGQ